MIISNICTMLVSIKEQFDAWMSDYGRKYVTEHEYDKRLAIFSQNAKMVSEHNSGKHSYTSKSQLPSRKGIFNYKYSFCSQCLVKLNKFADMTFEEFSQLMLMDPQHCSATREDVARHSVGAEPPSSIDWRSKGAITHVKNQVP